MTRLAAALLLGTALGAMFSTCGMMDGLRADLRRTEETLYTTSVRIERMVCDLEAGVTSVPGAILERSAPFDLGPYELRRPR